VLHIVVTAPPTRLPDMHLADALVQFFLLFHFSYFTFSLLYATYSV